MAAGGEGVGPGRHGLRLQCGRLPGGRRLVRDYAANISIERELVDRCEARPGGDLDRAPEPLAVDPEEGLRGEERAVRKVLAAEGDLRAVPTDGVAPGRYRLPGAGDRLCRGEGERGSPAREEHANRPATRPDGRPSVVVSEDVLVAGAVQGEALSAVLAHPDAVPPAPAVDHEDRGRCRARGARERKRTGDQEGESMHQRL